MTSALHGRINITANLLDECSQHKANIDTPLELCYERIIIGFGLQVFEWFQMFLDLSLYYCQIVKNILITSCKLCMPIVFFPDQIRHIVFGFIFVEESHYAY